MKMCVAVIAVQTFFGQMLQTSGDGTFVKKATLVYGRLLDIVFKLDHIDCEDSGKEYLNLADLVTDKRLMDKYEKMSAIWSENFDPTNTDWNSLLDAV
jgi:hypothetical protein